MKKIFVFLSLIFFSSAVFSVESYDVRFNNGHSNLGKTKYYVTIQIKAPTGQTFGMGNGNFTFNYNKTNLGNPISYTKHNFSGGAYATQTVNMPISGIVSVNIFYFDAGIDCASATIVGTNWMDVATIEFDLFIPTGCGDFVFRTESDVPAAYQCMNCLDVPVTRNSSTNEPACPLPVEFMYFNAAASGNSSALDWGTASEINNYGFEVQRYNESTQVWDNLGFVLSKAIGGNSLDKLTYDYLDENVYDQSMGAKTFYYRLRQVDFNGDFEFSEVKSVSFNSKTPINEITVKLFPNPVNDILFIELTNNQGQNYYDILVYDKFGKLVLTNQVKRKAQIDVSQLPQGSYSITIRNDKQMLITDMFTIAR
jgi:hypothetical protein